jgi:hypothetical protein
MYFDVGTFLNLSFSLALLFFGLGWLLPSAIRLVGTPSRFFLLWRVFVVGEGK